MYGCIRSFDTGLAGRYTTLMSEANQTDHSPAQVILLSSIKHLLYAKSILQTLPNRSFCGLFPFMEVKLTILKSFERTLLENGSAGVLQVAFHL